jgi:predicted ABC-type ATPase
MKEAPWFWIVGGPNGAGKTTFCLNFLPQWVHTYNYANADLIAAGISPLDVTKASVRAGKLMMAQTELFIREGKTFAVESTLSSSTFLKMAERLKAAGWKVGVVYLWLASDKIAMERVAIRVASGGHDIPSKTIVRRRERGLNSLRSYLWLADRWMIFDNSDEGLEPVIAEEEHGQEIFDAKKLKLILPGWAE